MALHRDLTGDELHEPKGIESAPLGSVYVANGESSGNWLDQHNGNLTLNKYFLDGKMTDISTPNDHVYFFVPQKSKIVSLAVVLDGPITVANNIITAYVNGVAYPDTLNVPFSGSGAGTAYSRATPTDNVLNAGVVVEVRTDGASSSAAGAYIQLGLQAIA